MTQEERQRAIEQCQVFADSLQKWLSQEKERANVIDRSLTTLVHGGLPPGELESLHQVSIDAITRFEQAFARMEERIRELQTADLQT